jgi:hypothetical protein
MFQKMVISRLILVFLFVSYFACLQAKWSVNLASKNYFSVQNEATIDGSLIGVVDCGAELNPHHSLDLSFNLVWSTKLNIGGSIQTSYPISDYLSLIRSSFATDEEKATKWWTNNTTTPILTIRNENAALATTSDHLLCVASKVSEDDAGQVARKRYLLQVFIATRIVASLVEQAASKHVTYLRMKHHLRVPFSAYMTFVKKQIEESRRDLLIEHSSLFPSPPSVEVDGQIVAQLVEIYARDYLVPFLNRAHPAVGMA